MHVECGGIGSLESVASADGDSVPLASLVRRKRLFRIGVPKDSILEYELALKAGKFLVLAHGTAADAVRAGDTLKGTNPAALYVHSIQRAAANNGEHAGALV